jgi:hypothetical protein
MVRKLIGAGVAALFLAILVTAIGSGSSSASVHPALVGPVTFTGNIECNLQGTLTVSPPATNSNPGPYTVTFTGTNNHCSGLWGTSLAQSNPPGTVPGKAVLKRSTESFTYTVPQNTTNDLCFVLQYGGTQPPVTTPFPINWMGVGTGIVPTATTLPAGTEFPGIMQWINGTVLGGSFPGTTDIALGYSLSTAAAACAGGGLSSIAMTDLGGHNLLVGTAF